MCSARLCPPDILAHPRPCRKHKGGPAQARRRPHLRRRTLCRATMTGAPLPATMCKTGGRGGPTVPGRLYAGEMRRRAGTGWSGWTRVSGRARRAASGRTGPPAGQMPRTMSWMRPRTVSARPRAARRTRAAGVAVAATLPYLTLTMARARASVTRGGGAAGRPALGRRPMCCGGGPMSTARKNRGCRAPRRVRDRRTAVAAAQTQRSSGRSANGRGAQTGVTQSGRGTLRSGLIQSVGVTLIGGGGLSGGATWSPAGTRSVGPTQSGGGTTSVGETLSGGGTWGGGARALCLLLGRATGPGAGHPAQTGEMQIGPVAPAGLSRLLLARWWVACNSCQGRRPWRPRLFQEMLSEKAAPFKFPACGTFHYKLLGQNDD